MSGGNVTIVQFASAAAMAAGDSVACYDASASTTVRFLATQVVTYVFSTDVALTNQTTSTSCATGAVSFFASSPAGFVTVSINGTSVKLPYYTV